MAFLNDITLGQYYSTNSFVHRLDPRTKIIAAFTIMIFLLVTLRIEQIGVMIVFISIVVMAAKLPALLVLRNLRPFSLLFVITFAMQLFYTGGNVFATVPLVNAPITHEGLYQGVIFTTRLALLIVLAAVLTLSTAPIEFTDALERLLQPLKRIRVPVHELVLIMSLSLRFIPTLMEEAERIKKAQISRGASFEGNLLVRIRSIIPLILPLFISAFRRADELAMAMDARCYHGGEGRTSFKKLAFGKNDLLVLGLMAILYGWFSLQIISWLLA